MVWALWYLVTLVLLIMLPGYQLNKQVKQAKLKHVLLLLIQLESFFHITCTKVDVYNETTHTHTHTHTRLMALCPGLPRWAGTRKVKPIWILLEQEIVSGSGISSAGHAQVCTSRQTTTPAPHHSVFYRSDALPAAQPTASKHWRH